MRDVYEWLNHQVCMVVTRPLAFWHFCEFDGSSMSFFKNVGFIWWVAMISRHIPPRKTKMEPENDGFLIGNLLFQGLIFRWTMLVFGGVNHLRNIMEEQPPRPSPTLIDPILKHLEPGNPWKTLASVWYSLIRILADRVPPKTKNQPLQHPQNGLESLSYKNMYVYIYTGHSILLFFLPWTWLGRIVKFIGIWILNPLKPRHVYLLWRVLDLF